MARWRKAACQVRPIRIHSSTPITIIKQLIATAALAGLAAAPASAATIYSETFSAPWEGATNDGTDPLNGTTPDVTTGTNTWTAATGFKENGSIAATGTTKGDASAFLAFSPSSGFVYTLSVTATDPTGLNTTGWAGLGFTNDNDVSNDVGIHENTNAASPWMLYRQNGAVVTFDGPGATGATSTAEGAYSGTQTLTIVLDTTAAQWTAEWFIGATSLDTVTYTTTDPSITHVGIGRGAGAGTTFSDFTLTAVPEPSAALVGGLGLLVLLRRRR